MNKFKKAISNVAALGSTLSLGVLSFSGMMLITPSIPIAVLSLFLAIAIEGAVYRQNIFAAMRRLGNQQIMIERAIALRELLKLKKIKDYQENKFLQDYFNQKAYLHDLEENLTYYTEQDHTVAKKEIQRVKERITEMEDLFISCMRNSTYTSSDNKSITNEINALLQAKKFISSEKLEEEIKKKKRYMNSSLIVAITAGTCAGLVSLSSMQTCLLAAGIGFSTVTFIAAPIVAFAAMGYMLMMYRTITDMIENDTVQKWIARLHQFWHTPQTERDASYYLKAIGAVALVALAVMATLATAGTWWYLAKAGAHIITALPPMGAAIISAITWAFTLIPNFLFNIVNAIKSINKIPGLIKNTFHGLSHAIKETWQNENILQFINPFRIIKKMFNAAIFIGHLFSMAVTADQTPGVSPIASTAVNLTMESLTDLHYVVDDSHTHDHPASTHTKQIHADNATHQHSSSEHAMHAQHKHHHHHHHDDEEDGHHHHGDFFLNKINLFFNYLSVGWDCLLSGNSWQAAKNKFFPQQSLPEVKPLSPEWTEFEVETQFDKKAKQYQQKGALEKFTAFHQLQQQASSSAQQTHATLAKKLLPVNFFQAMHTQIKDAKNAGQPLAQHRHKFRLFPQEPPRAIRFLDDMLVDRSLKLNRQ